MDEKKVVLVTGVTSGIGAATASLLSEQGCRVFGRSTDSTEAAPSRKYGTGDSMFATTSQSLSEPCWIVNISSVVNEL